MNYSLWDETFELIFEDFDKEDEYDRRYFILKDSSGKTYNFTVKYKMVDGFPEFKHSASGFSSSIPDIEQEGILLKSFGI